MDFQAARERLSGGNAATQLLRRLTDNDRREIERREAAEGIIGHCEICKAPFPDRPSYIKYTCPACAEKQRDNQDVIIQAKERAGTFPVTIAAEPKPAAPANAGPKLPALPKPALKPAAPENHNPKPKTKKGAK